MGGALGWLDPGAQSFDPFYSKPQPFESYASARGYQPGTPEYGQAVEDYRLGGWSDPAMENRTELEGVRYDQRDRLQDKRLKAQRDLAVIREARRSAPRPAASRPPTKSTVIGAIMAKQAAGTALTPAEDSVLRANGGGKLPEGTVWEDKDGNRYIRRGGKDYVHDGD